MLSNIEAHHHAKFSWNWSIAFQICRCCHLLGGNKNLSGSHDHNHAPFGWFFYLVRLDIASLCTKFDSSSLSRSLDMGWVESVIINWCEFLFSVLTVLHTISLPYFPLLHFPPVRSTPAFSTPVISNSAVFSCNFHSCVFYSRIFSVPTYNIKDKDTINIKTNLKTKLKSIISYIIKEPSNNIIGNADV